jgi:hypothetical protein
LQIAWRITQYYTQLPKPPNFNYLIIKRLVLRFLNSKIKNKNKLAVAAIAPAFVAIASLSSLTLCVFVIVGFNRFYTNNKKA